MAEILEILMKRTDLAVALTLSGAMEDAFEYTETRIAKSRLISIAGKGIDVKLEKCKKNANVKSPFLKEISSLLWRNGLTLSEESDGCLKIYEAKSPYEECAFVAEDIRRRVYEGARFSDFAIIARRADAYVGTLDDALKKNEVPHFFSKPSPIGSFEATKHIISAISTVASGFSREELISYMKSGFSGISREACDEFELYAETWQLNKSRFTDGELWNMRPEGYTLRLKSDSDARLLRINETKATVMKPLLNLALSFSKATRIREFASALFDFISECNIEEKIYGRIEKLRALGETEAAEEN